MPGDSPPPPDSQWGVFIIFSRLRCFSFYPLEPECLSPTSSPFFTRQQKAAIVVGV